MEFASGKTIRRITYKHHTWYDTSICKRSLTTAVLLLQVVQTLSHLLTAKIKNDITALYACSEIREYNRASHPTHTSPIRKCEKTKVKLRKSLLPYR